MNSNRFDRPDQEEVFSEAVRAGKRTYFFDVKQNRHGEKYIVVTESRRRSEQEGIYSFEKSKIFLYKEDFEKVESAFHKVLAIAKDGMLTDQDVVISDNENSEISDIDREFDEL